MPRYRVTIVDFDGKNLQTVDDEDQIPGWLWRTLKDRRQYAKDHGIYFMIQFNYLEEE
jgi:hypothetical protein